MKNDDIELLLSLRSPVALITSLNQRRTENPKSITKYYKRSREADFLDYTGGK